MTIWSGGIKCDEVEGRNKMKILQDIIRGIYHVYMDNMPQSFKQDMSL